MRMGVVGAGLMGAEIALVLARAGHDVLLTDSAPGKAEAALERLRTLHAKGAARGFWPAEEAEAVFARLGAVPSPDAFGACGLATEAVFEREEVKAGVLAHLDRVLPPGALIATNTSTIPIGVLAAHLPPARRPGFIGTHYFSPASRMALVEVIPGFETSPGTLAAVTDLLRGAGKTPVTIRDVPGFAVNRLLHVMLIEAVRLVEEGVASPADIDTACRLGLGHPLGPFELMDLTTSSLCLEAQEIMFEAYGERFRPRPLLKARVRAGYAGGKGKPGWRS